MLGIVEITRQMGGGELTASHRGVPPGTKGVTPANVAEQNWRPTDGKMNLPLLSLDLQTYNDNKKAMLDICAAFACEIAPHAKTPMSPALAFDLVASGAWGASVADLRQADVMLGHGVLKVLIANEVGGANAARRLARLVEAHRDADVHIFVDSVAFVNALADEWKSKPDLPKIRLLIEVGCGRGGVESDAEVAALIGAIRALSEPRIILAGVAAYEGTANRPDEADLQANLDDLFGRVASAFIAVRGYVGSEQHLILSIGGSSLFDHVIVRSGPLLKADANASLLLRSGACFFSDNGPIRDRLRAIAGRKLLGPAVSARIAGSFNPALRIWAEVLSVNHDHMAICGFGLRDVAHDQGVPVPLGVWRDGSKVLDLEGRATVAKLNDQHAFVRSSEGVLQIGDIIELGIRHPCTTIDKHDLIYVLDAQGQVTATIRTFFG